MQILRVLAIVAKLLPALAWLAAQIAEARDKDSDDGRRLSPDEIADLTDGFVARITPAIREIA